MRRRSGCARATSGEPEPKEENWPKDPPPVATRKHLRVSEVAVIALRDRGFAHSPAVADRLVEQIGLELVCVQPRLVEANSLVADDRRRECPKAVRRIRRRKPRQQSENQGASKRQPEEYEADRDADSKSQHGRAKRRAGGMWGISLDLVLHAIPLLALTLTLSQPAPTRCRSLTTARRLAHQAPV